MESGFFKSKPAYRLSSKEVIHISEARLKDIEKRGESHMVYDKNGKIVALKAASLWHENGKYVAPASTQVLGCNIM